MNEHGESSGEDGVGMEQVLHESNSSGRLGLGTVKFSVSDMLHEIYLWLMKQSKGKNIKASKVLSIFLIHYSFTHLPYMMRNRS